MALFIDGFSCEAVPKQNPGEKIGVCNEGYRFIYMTGSGAWSRLLKPGSLEDLLFEAQDKISMGYNQLWVFEKKLCVTPAPGNAGSGHRFDDKRREYPRELARHLWPGQLCVVLQDPEWAKSGPIVLTYHAKQSEAAAYAQVQADQLKVRTIVGLMLADVCWH